MSESPIETGPMSEDNPQQSSKAVGPRASKGTKGGANKARAEGKVLPTECTETREPTVSIPPKDPEPAVTEPSKEPEPTIPEPANQDKPAMAEPSKEPEAPISEHADGIKAKAAQPDENVAAPPADISFLTSVGQLPLAAAAVDQAIALYTWAKAQNEYVKYGLERGETITKDAAAVLSQSTIVQSVATRLHTLDTAAGHKMEELKKSYPLINKPPEQIFQATREQLAQFSSVSDYARVARQTEDLLKTQLQQNFDIARTKTNELVRTMQDQTQALVEYSKGLNLEQATSDIKKAYEAAQEYVSSALAGAQLSAKNQATAVKSTIGNHVAAIQNSQVLLPLQQQLEVLKVQLDNLVSTIKSSLNPQNLGPVEALHGKVEEALKAWAPVKDHLLAYFVSQNHEPKPEVETSSPA